jgi:ABC transporter DrrB family efflux protein
MTAGSASAGSASAGVAAGAGLTRPAQPARRWPGRDSALIAGRQLRVLRLNPGRLIYPLVQPVVLLVLFVSVLGNLALAGHGAGGAYRQFLIPGILVQNAALTAPSTGLGVLRDAGTGLADRFRSLPMSRSAVLVGRLAGDAIVFAVQAILLLAIATLLSFRVQTGWPGMAAIVLVTVSFGIAIAVASSWLALLIRDAEAAERVLFFPAIAVTFLSTAFAPVGELAGWIQPIARVSPVSAAADLIRSLAAGGPAAGPLMVLAAWVAGLVLIPGMLAVRSWQRPA